MTIPHGEYLARCNPCNHKGIRVIYRMEDTFENTRKLFQLGTRMTGAEGITSLALNVDLSWKNEQGSFAAVRLMDLKTGSEDLNDYFRTMLIS